MALDRVHSTPTHDVVSALFHAARGPDVVLTMVQGTVCYDGRRVLTLREDQLREQIQDIAARLHIVRHQGA